MKKNLKKLSSLAFVFALVFSLSLSAFAADVSAEKAEELALNDAGVSRQQVVYLVSQLEYDDGVKYYDVSFAVKNAEGNLLEYDYDVRVSDGKILEKDFDVERDRAPASSQHSSASSAAAQSAPSEKKDVGEAEAKKAALAFFGLGEEEVEFIEVRRDYEDGSLVYELEFCKPYSVKYSCDVVADNAAVRDAEVDEARGLVDKVELFFEVLFAKLFAR